MSPAERGERRPYSYAEFVTQLREQLDAAERPAAPANLGQSAALLWRVADLIADLADLQHRGLRVVDAWQQGDLAGAVRALDRALRAQRVRR